MSLGPFSVVHTALLAGAALVAVPILIHLFNKRRFRIVEWAAMELLRQVNQQNRRRLRVENLLILLLRCLIVLLLTLLVARTILGGSARFTRGAGGIERVFLLDDSPSMDVRQGNRTLFARTTAALADYVRRLARSRPGDTLTVILTSAPGQPFLCGQMLGGERAQDVANAIEALPVSALPAHFEESLAALQEMVARDPAVGRTVSIISDFRRYDWLGRDSSAPRQLGALAGSVAELVLVQAGQPVAADLAITELRCGERFLTAGGLCPFLVTVANRGTTDSGSVPLVLTAEGTPAGHVNVPVLAPGASRTFTLPVTFLRPGPVVVEAELTNPDQLAFDNRRQYAATVEPAIRILVVDGEPDPDPARSEAFYLRHALAPRGDLSSGMRVEVVDESHFDPRALETVHALILCNVYRLAKEHWLVVADWVRRGGGLLVFPGDQVDGASWNEMAKDAPAGFVPARFGEMAGDPSERAWQTLRLTRPDHPVLQAFAGDRNPFLQRVKVFRYWQLVPTAEPPAETLAAFANGSSALVEALFGAGRVLLFATAADTEWSNWPGDPSYLVTLQQAVRIAARAPASERILAAGQPLRYEALPSLYRGEASLYPPQAREAELLRATAASNAPLVVFQHSAVRQPGLWNLDLSTHEGLTVRMPFAVNIVPEESLLDAAESAELLRRAAHPRIRFVRGPELPDASDATGGQRDLTPLLASLLIAVLMLESALSWWFGRRRRSA
jgi:hypothetical protein